MEQRHRSEHDAVGVHMEDVAKELCAHGTFAPGHDRGLGQTRGPRGVDEHRGLVVRGLLGRPLVVGLEERGRAGVVHDLQQRRLVQVVELDGGQSLPYRGFRGADRRSSIRVDKDLGDAGDAQRVHQRLPNTVVVEESRNSADIPRRVPQEQEQRLVRAVNCDVVAGTDVVSVAEHMGHAQNNFINLAVRVGLQFELATLPRDRAGVPDGQAVRVLLDLLREDVPRLEAVAAHRQEVQEHRLEEVRDDVEVLADAVALVQPLEVAPGAPAHQTHHRRHHESHQPEQQRQQPRQHKYQSFQ